MLCRSHAGSLCGVLSRVVSATEHRFHFSELRGLKATGRRQARTKRLELQRRHSLEHIDLLDTGFHDGANPTEKGKRSVSVTVFQSGLQSRKLVENLLEPELIDLMNGDEQQLIVLRAIGEWLLQRQEFIDLEIGRIGDGFLMICRRH
jgi:hypothetical protein